MKLFLPLPSDHKDHPWYKRCWYSFEILIGRRSIKVKCCESFRDPKKMLCCKGCYLLYNKQSPKWWGRLLAKIGKKRFD